MKTLVISLQEQNWEDDGGDHDPFITQLNDADYAELQKGEVLSSESTLVETLRKNTIVEVFPMTIDAVETVWISYEF